MDINIITAKTILISPIWSNLIAISTIKLPRYALTIFRPRKTAPGSHYIGFHYTGICVPRPWGLSNLAGARSLFGAAARTLPRWSFNRVTIPSNLARWRQPVKDRRRNGDNKSEENALRQPYRGSRVSWRTRASISFSERGKIRRRKIAAIGLTV